MDQIAYIGKNSINILSEIINNHVSKRIFLVTGKQSYEKSGAKKIIESFLKDIEYFRFCDFEENPKLEDVYKGINIYNRDNFDMVIAIGGGSVLDMGKLINILSCQQGDIKEHIINNRIISKGKTLIAIPTTAGTGSEATHFAVIYIDGRKYSLAHKYILPNYAIIDPQFTYSSSKYLSACTGADAFSQAIESMWAVEGTDESKQYAKKAIDLLWNNLYNAVVIEDKEAKDKVSEGAYWAGRAINISKTTAPHALSYFLTSKYNIKHGQAVIVFLPYFLKYNYDVEEKDCNDVRGCSYVKTNIKELFSLLSVDNVKEASENLIDFIKSIGLVTNVKDLDGNISMKIVYKNVNIHRLVNNPRKLCIE